MIRALHVGKAIASTTFRLPSHQICHASSLKYWVGPTSWPGLQRRLFSGEGEGKGGGSGGSIRSAGGAFGKMAAAHEEQYFREEQARQVKELKSVMKETLQSELNNHEMEITAHMDGIRRHKERMAKGNNRDLHNFNISQLEEAIKHEQAQIDKVRDKWKRLRLD